MTADAGCDDAKEKDPAAIDPSVQRDRCHYCDVQYDPALHEHRSVPSNVKAFKDKAFTVWRCSGCKSLHCLDKVDLDYYYGKYPFGNASLSLPLRLLYRNLASPLYSAGMQKEDFFLDYGCNQGHFVKYLRERGHCNVFGYDPYSNDPAFADKTVLAESKFDFILIQDVIEHVESPIELLRELDRFLKPGGYVVVGCPNAEGISLENDGVKKYLHQLHQPYHLRIPTRAVVEGLGQMVGWNAAVFSSKSYGDTLWPGLNDNAIMTYLELMGNCLDAAFEPLDLRTALTSPRFLFNALFGYFWGRKEYNMTCVLHKPVRPPSS